MKNRPLKIATCCLAGTLFTTLPAYNVLASPSAGVTKYASAMAGSELNTSSTSAGVSLAVAGYLEKNITTGTEDTKEASSAEAGKSKAKKEVKEDKKSTVKDTVQYDKMAVAQVQDYVNIRKKPDENAQLLGKLYSKSVATVIRKKETGIRSNPVRSQDM